MSVPILDKKRIIFVKNLFFRNFTLYFSTFRRVHYLWPDYHEILLKYADCIVFNVITPATFYSLLNLA